ncbi:MAG: hypothetical protein HYT50_02395 [Candidatus Wildermuthbacteria bacterium]|nr:hypothetical protein [Candidatus Wildermuthbacteria bacterium]
MQGAKILLRVGLAFTFSYAAVSSFLHPLNWIGYFPLFMRELVPEGFLLVSFSVFEIALSLWLLSGKFGFFASALAAASLLGIIVFNLAQMEVVFRDVGLFLAACALAWLQRTAIDKGGPEGV